MISQSLFSGKLVGNRRMKKHVLEVLSQMDEKVISFITKKCRGNI